MRLLLLDRIHSKIELVLFALSSSLPKMPDPRQQESLKHYKKYSLTKNQKQTTQRGGVHAVAFDGSEMLADA